MPVLNSRCLIDGQLVGSHRTGKVHNPANAEEVVGTYPLLGIDDVDNAVRSAERAQLHWRRVPAVDRAALVLQSAEKLATLDGLHDLLVREQGKVGWETVVELGTYGAVAQTCAAMAEELDQGSVLLQDSSGTTTQYHDPIGVVAAVTPWNWPISIAAMKVVPALVAGCTVIVKPSPVAPLTVMEGFAALAEYFPPGVLNVLTGTDEEVSAPLLSHPSVRKVTLTGSTATGQLAAAAAAQTLKSITLELGGNDAALVLDDIAIDDQLCSQLVADAFVTTGQVCVAIKRIYAPRHRVEDLIEGLVAALERSVIGDGLDPSSTMGPLTTQRQRQHVQDLLAGAESVGAKVFRAGVLNGDPDRGWFMLPAVVADCPEGNALVQAEQFGPALPVQPYDDDDQALDMINATKYGLTASVWTSDADRAARFARHIEAGVVHHNCHGVLAADPRVPFGGVKYSGLGRELGLEGLHEFTQTHVVNLRRP